MIGDLRFSGAWVVWLAPLLLLLVGLTLVAMKRRQALLNAFGEPSLLTRFSDLGPERLSGLRPLLHALSLAAIGAALAGPVLRTSPGEDGRRPVDIVVVLDVSRSMGAEDYASRVSRLGKAREMLLEALPDLAGTRVGIVTFAGAAFRQAPLTDDHAALGYILSNWIFIESAPPGGSDLAQGMGTAVRLLEGRPGERIVFALLRRRTGVIAGSPNHPQSGPIERDQDLSLSDWGAPWLRRSPATTPTARFRDG